MRSRWSLSWGTFSSGRRRLARSCSRALDCRIRLILADQVKKSGRSLRVSGFRPISDFAASQTSMFCNVSVRSTYGNGLSSRPTLKTSTSAGSGSPVSFSYS